ncbi:MAG: hypothetical protein GWP02_01790, partial [Desulfobulbaceae bacterium]|nr:hypothetical protein [Desulfobulbaceae bacterium]
MRNVEGAICDTIWLPFDLARATGTFEDIRPTLRNSTLTIAALLLCGCGGGGGSGGSGGSPPPPAGSSEPPAPVINYGGNSQPALIDKTNATYFAGLAVALRPLSELIESTWIPIPQTQGSIRTTVNGSGGGSAVITGNITSVSTGYIDVDFRSLTENGVVIDGRYVQRYRNPGSPQAGFIYSEADAGFLEFHDLTIGTSTGDITLRGTMQISGGNLERFDIDLMVTDGNSGDVIYYKDCAIDFSTVTIAGSSGRFGLELSGTIHDASLGSVQMTPTGPLPEFALFEPAGFAIAARGGGFQLESAGPLIELRALSRRFAALMIDIDGDGALEESLRTSWDALAGLPEDDNSVTTGPIANAGNMVFGHLNENVTVHGLYSHDDDGDWLTFNWRILTKPLSSQVELVSPNLPVQTFTADRDGDYLLGLHVSDGVDVRETSIQIRIDFASNAPRAVETATAGLDVAEPFQIGAPITVDGRATSNRPYVLDPVTWLAEGPGNQNISDTGNRFIKVLTVDSDGLHHIWMRQSGVGDSVATTYGEAIFSVGQQLHETKIEIVESFSGREVMPLDYNQDGRLDLVVLSAVTGTWGFQTLTENPAGSYDVGPMNDSGLGELAAGDINNDGLIDIAVSDRFGIYVSLQKPDESFADAVFYGWPNASCLTSGDGRDIGVGDADGDGLDDLLAINPCDWTLLTWSQNSNGDLDPPVAQPINETVQYAAFTDFNSDGLIDAVLSVGNSGNLPPAALYLLGQTGGAFQIVDRINNPT